MSGWFEKAKERLKETSNAAFEKARDYKNSDQGQKAQKLVREKSSEVFESMKNTKEKIQSSDFVKNTSSKVGETSQWAYDQLKQKVVPYLNQETMDKAYSKTKETLNGVSDSAKRFQNPLKSIPSRIFYGAKNASKSVAKKSIFYIFGGLFMLGFGYATPFALAGYLRDRSYGRRETHN